MLALLPIQINFVNSKFIDCGKYFEVSPNLSEDEQINLKCAYYCDENLFSYKSIGEKYEISPNVYRYKTQQQFNEIPIYGAIIVIEKQNTITKPIYGNLYDTNHISKCITSLKPLLTEQQILDILFKQYNIKQELIIGNDINAIDIQLYIDAKSLQPHKVYIIKFMYLYNNKPYKVHIIMNSDNGEIEQFNFNSYSISSSTTIATGAGGNPKIGLIISQKLIINSAPFIANDHILIYNGNHFNYTEIRDNPDNTIQFACKSDNTDCIVNDEFINESPCVGCDVFNNINIIYDLYSNWLNENNPIITDQIRAYIHIGINENGAWYSYGTIWISDGDNNITYPYSILDILAHEIGHGYTDKYSCLIYAGESGAINEAYSDLVSAAVKSYNNIEGLAIWTLGYGIYKQYNKAIRYMYEPTKDGYSIDHYNNYYDGMDIHYASGIYNKAFYLLYINCKMSIEMIFKIVSMANNKYWNPYTNFNQGVCAIYEALYELYGDTEIINEQSKCLVDQFITVGIQCVIIPDIVNVINDDNIESINIVVSDEIIKPISVSVSGKSKTLKLFRLLLDNKIKIDNDISQPVNYLTMTIIGGIGNAHLYVFNDFKYDNYFCYGKQIEECVIDINELNVIGNEIFVGVYGFINYENVLLTISQKVIEIENVFIDKALIINNGIGKQKLKYKFNVEVITSKQRYINIELYNNDENNNVNSIIMYVYDENGNKICQTLLSDFMNGLCLFEMDKQINFYYVIIESKNDFKSLKLLITNGLKKVLNSLNNYDSNDSKTTQYLLLFVSIVFIVFIKIMCDNDMCQLWSNRKQYIYGQNKQIIEYNHHNNQTQFLYV